MQTVETLLVSLPAERCGCVIDRVLVEEQSWLATGPGGRKVVLKPIDPECLLKGSLHPSVRDRLSRVRELAHGSVANLFGVERDGDTAYLMWEYVDGVTFDFYVTANRTPREIAMAARELVLAVDLLHMQGIIHGALIGSNVIVAPGSTVRLTHISPLLYTDPSVDAECIWNLLESAAEQLGDRGTLLALAIAETRARKEPLRKLATRLSALIDTRDAKKSAEAEVRPPSSARKRSLVGAALVAGLGMALAWSAWHTLDRASQGSHENIHLPFQARAER